MLLVTSLVATGNEHRMLDLRRRRLSSVAGFLQTFVFPLVFLGFTGAFSSKFEWGSTQNVLMIMLYWRKQIPQNCAYLLPNTKSTHTVKNYFTPMTVHRFGVDPQRNL